MIQRLSIKGGTVLGYVEDAKLLIFFCIVMAPTLIHNYCIFE